MFAKYLYDRLSDKNWRQEVLPYWKGHFWRRLAFEYRNYKAQPALHKKLDELMSQPLVTRHLGETDAELRIRLAK